MIGWVIEKLIDKNFFKCYVSTDDPELKSLNTLVLKFLFLEKGTIDDFTVTVPYF